MLRTLSPERLCTLFVLVFALASGRNTGVAAQAGICGAGPCPAAASQAASPILTPILFMTGQAARDAVAALGAAPLQCRHSGKSHTFSPAMLAVSTAVRQPEGGVLASAFQPDQFMMSSGFGVDSRAPPAQF